LGGGFGGAYLAGRQVESLYQFRDGEQQEQYVQFILAHYYAP
jgi:hypothetical protein